MLRICENRSELRTVLEQYADFVLIGKGGDRLNLPTKFAVHGRGYVKMTEDLCRFCSAADLLIYLGLEDNLPNVILEAMACAVRRFWHFATGGVSDMFTDKVTGSLVRSGSLADFAVTLGVMLGDAHRLSWLGLNGRETVLRRISDQVVGPRLRHFMKH
jgi:glycosyltransferase involved in cell wall biosynthesis